MKSTIKNTYQRRVAADGTITLEYQAPVISAHQGASLMGLMVLAFGMLLLVMTIVGMFILNPLLSGHSDAHVIGGLIFAVITTVLLLRRVLARTYTLVLTPEGMIFPRFAYGPMTDQLPYADITSLSIQKKSATNNGQYMESCTVNAYAGGAEVKLTRDVPQSLADAILQEINQQLAKVAA
jgi:hypothetical protein